jgi:FemAB-related protein (PEP-CTERM system-associated)
MQVAELQDHDKSEWDSYLDRSQESSIYHLASWKDVMESTFDLQAHFLLARQDGQIVGVLPLLHVESVLSGNYFTSMPGAISAETVEAAQALFKRAKELVNASGAQYLILRDSHRCWNFPELMTKDGHCTMMVDLSTDSEPIWRGVNRRVRQSTKRAIAAGLEVMNDPEQLEDFYPAYSTAMRDLGTPTQGIEFFRNILGHFPDQFTVMTVRNNHQILGGGLVAKFRDTVYQTWGGMLRQYYDLNPNYILYWETIKAACGAGYHWLDLGRSEWDSGTYRFKKHWLSEPQPLYQQFYLNGVDQPPRVGSKIREEPKYRFVVSIWQRLPMAVTEALGPWIRKQMPFG